MDIKLITRPALGRFADLGDVYDAHTDTFCGVNIFKNVIPIEARRSNDNPRSEYRFVQSHNFLDKCSAFDISGEIQASVLANMITPEGSGRFLQYQKMSTKSVMRSLVHRVHTVEERVNFGHEYLKQCYSVWAMDLAAKLGTHVVQEISWGANMILSCAGEIGNGQNEKQVGDKISAKLDLSRKQLQNFHGPSGYPENININSNSGVSSGGLVNVGQKYSHKSNNDQFDIQIFGDVVPHKEELPTTLDGAIALMKILPRLIATCNNGKGMQLSYILIPLSQLQVYRNVELEKIFLPLDDDCFTRIVKTFDQMNDLQQQIVDLYEDAQIFKYCIKQDYRNKISKLHHKVVKEYFRPKLANLLKDIRSRQGYLKRLDQFFDELDRNLNPVAILKNLSEWSETKNKINFARMLHRNKANYIGNDKCLEDELLDCSEDSRALIFYFTGNAKAEDRKRRIRNEHIFIEEIKKNEGNCKYYAVDCDFHPNARKKELSSYIQVVNGQNIVAEDLILQKEKSKVRPMTRAITGTLRVVHQPIKRGPFSSPCTGIKCDPNHIYEWTCQKCMEKMVFGFDGTALCRCGQTPVKNLEFRCTDENHGTGFQKHDYWLLDDLLHEIKPFKELNILLVGETGVGKSTWINGFFNFLQFDSFAEAENEELSFLISEQDDEPFEARTQTPTVYPFIIGSTIVRLIDTPGIGTDAGVMQDKLHLECMFATLTGFEEIHAICIFLRANETKHSLKVRYCVSELLSSFSLDAQKNVIFCFTQSRSSNYHPGNTLPILRSVVGNEGAGGMVFDQNNVYSFDMEAIDYLYNVKGEKHQTITFDNKVKFSESWEKSFQETNRMLEHVRELQPHKISNSFKLNLARECVFELYPLAAHWNPVKKLCYPDYGFKEFELQIQKMGLQFQDHLIVLF